MDFINKKAIVFGGTSGIGLATVKMLEIAGTEVVAIGRSSEKKSQLPNGVKFVACDVRDEMSVKKLLYFDKFSYRWRTSYWSILRNGYGWL